MSAPCTLQIKAPAQASSCFAFPGPDNCFMSCASSSAHNLPPKADKLNWFTSPVQIIQLISSTSCKIASYCTNQYKCQTIRASAQKMPGAIIYTLVSKPFWPSKALDLSSCTPFERSSYANRPLPAMKQLAPASAHSKIVLSALMPCFSG